MHVNSYMPQTALTTSSVDTPTEQGRGIWAATRTSSASRTGSSLRSLTNLIQRFRGTAALWRQ